MKLQRQHLKLLFLSVLLCSRAMGTEKPTTEQRTCVTAECHNIYQLKSHVHGPVAVGACKTCHQLENAADHTYSLVRQGKDLCSFCHLEQNTTKFIHEPLETGECDACHDPHASDHRFLLPHATTAQLCYSCHDTAKEATHLHGPVAIGECSICHDSHGSDHENLLPMSTTRELCFSCHETTHDELTRFEYVHQPVQEDCTQCHDSHGSTNDMLLVKPSPALCFDCHQDVKDTLENATVQHHVMGKDTDCRACHTPHASTVPAGLKADPKSLCMSCHDQTIEMEDGKELANFKAELEGKQFQHGPVSQNDCRSCHISHGSSNFRLLIKAYPAAFYAPFNLENYELCFECHTDSLVLAEQTDALTDFRNGDWNLHYLHVNKPDRGRTCRACHATHASNLPKHIRETVPYGNWELPVQFAKTETGGTCLPGCHAERPYDRENPVEYEFMKPEEAASDTTIIAVKPQ